MKNILTNESIRWIDEEYARLSGKEKKIRPVPARRLNMPFNKPKVAQTQDEDILGFYSQTK